MSPWHTFQLDMVRCLWAILPPTILWGASFPLAVAALARPGEDPGQTVGSVYAANTLGAIFGALIVSLALIPWIGTQDSQRVLIWTAARRRRPDPGPLRARAAIARRVRRARRRRDARRLALLQPRARFPAN